VTSASPGRARLSTVALTAVIVALTAFIVLSAMLSGTFSAVHLWSAAGLIMIIVVTAVVGLVVFRHQPGNPIGWLLAGEAIFMLANIAAGSYAQTSMTRASTPCRSPGRPRSSSASCSTCP